MICAVYCRKSNEEGTVESEAKSVTVQLADAKAYAGKKGWTVAAEHIYFDDGVSGVAFGDARPGLARLLNALKPRAPFQALIMTEDSRLGREMYETSYVLKQIIDAGVRVFLCRDDVERTLNGAMDKMMASLAGFASEMEREKNGQRVRFAMRARAQRAAIPGGSCYGYRYEGPKRSRTTVIDPAQAAIVRRIFGMISDGLGYASIAKRLNAEHVPSARPARGWDASSIRALVRRDLYRGKLVYGHHGWVRRQGRRVRVAQPESQWVTRDVPDLRIIDDHEWDAAHSRIDKTRAVYLQRMEGRSLGRPEAGIESKYLLGGLTTCGTCLGGMHAANRGERSTLSYLCTQHRAKGSSVCDNFLALRRCRCTRRLSRPSNAISWSRPWFGTS